MHGAVRMLGRGVQGVELERLVAGVGHVAPRSAGTRMTQSSLTSRSKGRSSGMGPS